MHQVTIKRYCWKNVRKHEIAYTSPFLPHSFCQDWRIQPKDGVMSACFAIIFIQSFDINLTIYPVFQQYMICSGIIHGELIESMRVFAFVWSSRYQYDHGFPPFCAGAQILILRFNQRPMFRHKINQFQ